MPTLGEFVTRARVYGYSKHTIRVPELRAKLVYLRRAEGDLVKLVELPAVSESVRLAREVVRSLCATAGIPAEDFGVSDE